MENVIILGTGIAGSTAAIYNARANLSPLVIGGPEEGGQLTLTTDVDNFPGFPEGIQGPELVQNARKQAERFGARYITGIAEKFEKTDRGYKITLNNGNEHETKALIIATGASARWLGLESEQKYKGKGVSTCATCDGAFYKGKEVLVIGGGDSAMEEANFLTKFADKVTVIHRRDELRASKIMQDKFFKNPKTEIIWNSEIKEVVGDKTGVTGAKLYNNKTKEETEIKCHGIFLAIGHIPNTKIFKEILNMDELGYLKVNERNQTNLPGVFAAGDVHDTRYRQAITAAGSGCRSAIEAEKYIENMEK